MKRAHLWLLMCVVWVATACSLLLDPENDAPRCVLTEGTPDPCPKGLICTSGRCRPLGCSKVEICGDGVDDDCDGKVDERVSDELELCGDRKDNDCDGQVDEREDGNTPEMCGNGVDDDCDTRIDEGHDQDMDGKLWCGNLNDPQGARDADCDDFDPTVRPGLPEICDGRDNDCDERVDEATDQPLCAGDLVCVDQRCTAIDCTPGGDECGPGQRCDEKTRHCVADGCMPEGCPAPQYCDQTSGECRTTRRSNGDACVVDTDCMSGTCADRVALRISGDVPRVCVKACCSNSDCASEEVCHVSGSGARSCLPTSMAPLPQNPPTPCLATQACGAFQQCTLASGQSLPAPAQPVRNDLVTPICALASGDPIGDGCLTDQQCASKACVSSPGIYPPSVCSRPCGTSADCAELEEQAAGIFAAGVLSYCRYVAKGPEQDWVPICVLPQFNEDMGTGAFGASCASGSTCLEGSCVGAGADRPGICSIACCRDSDCPALSGKGATRCRPVAFGEHFEMRCLP